jgi:septum formation protein
VDPSDIKETMDAALGPHELAQKLSLDKAKAVAVKHKDALIIAADTFGVFRGKIMGKPHSKEAAIEMLRTLNGKMHSVVTGFTIIDTETGKTVSESVVTKVYFRTMTIEEIDSYANSGEPLDKAGAYAIQGRGAVIVDRIDGDYFNVMGLPLSALAESLKGFGVNVL